MQFPALLNACFPQLDSNQVQSLWDVFTEYLKEMINQSFPIFSLFKKNKYPFPLLILEIE